LRPGAEPQELYGAEAQTSNNQMELRAVLEALRALDGPHQVVIYTDSQYLRRGITEWLPVWEERGWRTAAKQAVKNQDLWQALAEEIHRHHIEWRWVKGHAGDKWNERADTLARSMIPTSSLPLEDDSAIHIFEAASYLGSYKQGGWGVILRYRDAIKNLQGHESETSANRMHLVAAIEGLQAVKKVLPIHFYTSSDYVFDGITKWVKAWRRQNWKTKTGKPVSNQDLWEKLAAIASGYQIQWHVATKPDWPELMIEAKALADEAVRVEAE
jgi:ribonuclease HI